MVIKKSLVTIFIGFLSLFLFACDKVIADGSSSSTQNQTKSKVPANAVWIGGADGGVHAVIKHKKETNPNIYYVEIYYPSGELWYKGNLKLQPSSSKPLNLKQGDLFSGWDGKNLYLVDGRMLSASKNKK